MSSRRTFCLGLGLTVALLRYLFVADDLVCVVQLVVQDVSVAGDGFVPAQGDGGGCIGDRLQVGGWTRHLH